MRRLILIISFILAGLTSIAQDSQLTMSLSKETVVVGERFKLSITIKGASSAFVPPRLEGFNVLAGPIERSNTQLSNQGFSTSKTISYVLSASAAGTHTISAAETRTSKGLIRSNTVDIKVLERSTSAEPSNKDEQEITVNMPNGFKLKSFASKKEVVVGEPILVSYILYANENNVQLSEYRNPPQHKGFISKNTTVESPSWVLSPDRSYKKMHLADQILVPVLSGTLYLVPYEATVAKARFFSGNKYLAKSDLLRIKVNPLPPGSSPDFRGAVGDMSISASLSHTTVNTNSPVHLTVRVSGSGNLESITLPELFLPEGLESYPPEIKDQLTTASGTIQGSRTFDFLIIPRRQGQHRIPPIRFEYYNTETKQYEQQQSRAMTLLAEGAESSTSIERPGQPDLSSPNSAEAAEPANTGQGFLNAKSLPYLIGTPLLALLLFFGVRKLKNSSAEKAERKARQADQIAERILMEARNQKDAGNTAGFYSSLYQAMNRYAEQKFQIPTAEMSRARISRELANRSVDEATLSAWSRILDQCEQAAYSRAGVENPETLYEEVSQLIKNLEGQC